MTEAEQVLADIKKAIDALPDYERVATAEVVKRVQELDKIFGIGPVAMAIALMGAQMAAGIA